MLRRLRTFLTPVGMSQTCHDRTRSGRPISTTPDSVPDLLRRHRAPAGFHFSLSTGASIARTFFAAATGIDTRWTAICVKSSRDKPATIGTPKAAVQVTEMISAPPGVSTHERRRLNQDAAVAAVLARAIHARRRRCSRQSPGRAPLAASRLRCRTGVKLEWPRFDIAARDLRHVSVNPVTHQRIAKTSRRMRGHSPGRKGA
jgi:hypothetical protein